LSKRTRLLTRYVRQFGWLRRRLEPKQCLGLHLTLGLLAASGCLWLFGELAENLTGNFRLVRFDEEIATALHNSATPTLTTFFLMVTALGSIARIALASFVIFVIFVVRRRWLVLEMWLAAVVTVVGSVALVELLKALFARPRPYFIEPLLFESGYSFPSGHALESLVIYGMLAYFAVLALRTWRAKMAIVCGTAMLVLLIGFSRVYLGVHYFSDVAAGFAAGGVWLSTCITAMECIRRGRHRTKTTSKIDTH
jgi:membrane-associated phospholipid phosphatase